MHRQTLLLSCFLLACSAKGEDTAPAKADGAAESSTVSDSSPGETSLEDGGFTAEAAPMDAAPEKTSTVYANTDDTLYEMDPTTKDVKLIGTFSGLAMG
ncbi:MAG: hypothetical protein ACXWP4_28880, partial [Polyangiales bacterium]